MEDRKRPEHRPNERGVPGGAYRKKQPLSERIIDKLLGDDMMSIPDRLVDEFLMPRLGELGYDLTVAAVNMAFKREGRGRGSRRGGYRERDDDYREDYSRYSERDRPRSTRRPSYDFDSTSVEFRSRDGALDALDYMQWRCDKYRRASVADFLGKARISSRYTDNNFGWTDLSRLSEDNILPGEEGGWVIDLPPVEDIRNR